MYWPDTQTGVDVEPARKPVASAVRKFFTEGGAGQPPTVPGGDWFNQVTNELLNVLAAAGIDPSKADDDQLLQAIQAIISDAESSLRQELASDTGSTLLGIGHGRTQASKNTDMISVRDEGAKGDSVGTDGTDDTPAFLSAIAKAKAEGKVLWIDSPQLGKGYRLTAPIDVRGLVVFGDQSVLHINHSGIGVIFGGAANNPNNPAQYFGTVTRATGTAGVTTPDMRCMGAKGQEVSIQRCDYVQLYADDTAGPNYNANYSIAYSKFYFKKVHAINIKSADGTKGWINENDFFLGRTNIIRFEAGLYDHNHNVFHRGTMEGPGEISILSGSNNYFNGLRFERSGSNPADILNITLHAGSWNNHIEITWQSSPGWRNGIYDPNLDQVNVTDSGFGNSIIHTSDKNSDNVSLLALSPTTPFISALNAGQTGLLNKNTSVHGLRFVKHLANNKFLVATNFADVFADDRMIKVKKGDTIGLESDKAIWRPIVFLYDTNGNPILTEPAFDAIFLPGKNWQNGAYSISANTASAYITIADSRIGYVRFVVGSGSNAQNQVFSYLRAAIRQSKEQSRVLRKSFDIMPTMVRRSSLIYYNASDIFMGDIEEGVPCYKSDMTEMKVNHIRQRYIVESVTGNVVKTLRSSVQYFDIPNSFLVYVDSSNNHQMLAISSVSGQNVTLVNPPPAELVAGMNVDYLVTKTKVLA